MIMNKNQWGLALGSLFGLTHLLWVSAVATGLGQSLADMMHSAHFVSMEFTISDFSLGTATFGIIGAFVVGYVTGWVFGWLGNLFEKKK